MVNLELDHFFILTDRPKEAGDLLVSMGLNESFSRNHTGQGTSNRRFEFSNGMLEILYVRDQDEANNGPAKHLRFPERTQNNSASPFGIILIRTDESNRDIPFDGWTYQPDYFEAPNAFHIGKNSETLQEPLCIYAPFIGPVIRKEDPGKFRTTTNVEIVVPTDELSETLRAISRTDRLEITSGNEHLANMTLDGGRSDQSRDLRPILPLVVYW